MGWLPDVPDLNDYTEDTPKVAVELAKTRLVSRVAGAVAPARSTPARATSAKSAAAAAPAKAPALAVPPTVDLRQWCSPIEDQGQLGSCTANAAVAMVEYFERRAFNKHIDGSRLFVYKTTRNLLGWTGDTGAYLRSAMGALVLFGVPPESYWPYNVAKLDVEPSSFLYALGQQFQSLSYFRLDPAGDSPTKVLDNIKEYLAGGFPSMFGFPVYDEFMNVPKDGLVALPKKGSKQYGGHAIVAVGYDDNKQIGADKGALLIRNSWGTGWGLAGYAWMSYKYVTTGLALDWWTSVKCEWVDTGQF
jgi:C1A family cysteine protease